MTTTPDVVESIDIAISPEAAYQAISDPTRIASWSPEFQKAFVDAGTNLRVGQKFTGGNRNGFRRWRTVSAVVRAKKPSDFAFDVRAAGIPISRWSYSISATPTGCTVTESWTDLRDGPLGKAMWAIGAIASGVSDRATHNQATMKATLAAMKADLEG